MRTIWKFPLQVTDMQEIVMPQGATILKLAVQGDTPCLWALVDPDAEKISHCIRSYGTGHDVPDYAATESKYLDTVLLGPFVWHFFLE